MSSSVDMEYSGFTHGNVGSQRGWLGYPLRCVVWVLEPLAGELRRSLKDALAPQAHLTCSRKEEDS